MKNTPLVKECLSCHVVKPAKDFSNMRTAKDGLNTVCRECFAVYYKKNKARMDAKHAEYVEKNKARVRATRLRRMDRNREWTLYMLSFEGGAYYIGTTSRLKGRIHNHKHKLRTGKHTKRMLKLGSYNFDVTVLDTFEDEKSAREAELGMLLTHVGRDKCANTIRSAVEFGSRIDPSLREYQEVGA